MQHIEERVGKPVRVEELTAPQAIKERVVALGAAGVAGSTRHAHVVHLLHVGLL